MLFYIILYIYKYIYISDIFPSTFLQPVNGSKKINLELSYETQFLHVFFFFFFVFEAPVKDFPFYSPILLTFWFRYLQTPRKESSMYLSSQLLFRPPHKTLKSQEKSKKDAFSSNLQTYISKFSLWCLSAGNHTEPLN